MPNAIFFLTLKIQSILHHESKHINPSNTATGRSGIRSESLSCSTASLSLYYHLCQTLYVSLTLQIKTYTSTQKEGNKSTQHYPRSVRCSIRKLVLLYSISLTVLFMLHFSLVHLVTQNRTKDRSALRAGNKNESTLLNTL